MLNPKQSCKEMENGMNNKLKLIIFIQQTLFYNMLNLQGY